MHSTIGGHSRIIGLIADPVEHAKSPALVNDLLQRRQCFGDYVMVPMHVPGVSLASVVAGLRGMQNFMGAVVSMPHKISIVSLVDELSSEAAMVGAVNVVRRTASGSLSGALFDGQGFLAGVLSEGHAVRGADCILGGAGGAGAAIAYALVQGGCGSLTIVNRTPEKAVFLAGQLKKSFPTATVFVGDDDCRHYDLMVNATSLGMNKGDPLPFSHSAISRSALVAECVVSRRETELLAFAQGRGCKTHPGIHMLESQLELMLDFIQAE